MKTTCCYSHEGNDVESLHISGDKLISVCDEVVQVEHMESREMLWKFHHDDGLYGTILHGNQLILCCEDNAVRVLDLANGRVLHRLDHPDPCYNADLSPNKLLLAVACRSAVVLWDMRTLVKHKQFDLGYLVYDLRFNPTGDKLIVGLYEGEVFKIEIE